MAKAYTIVEKDIRGIGPSIYLATDTAKEFLDHLFRMQTYTSPNLIEVKEFTTHELNNSIINLKKAKVRGRMELKLKQ